MPAAVGRGRILVEPRLQGRVYTYVPIYRTRRVTGCCCTQSHSIDEQAQGRRCKRRGRTSPAQLLLVKCRLAVSTAEPSAAPVAPRPQRLPPPLHRATISAPPLVPRQCVWRPPAQSLSPQTGMPMLNRLSSRTKLLRASRKTSRLGWLLARLQSRHQRRPSTSVNPLKWMSVRGPRTAKSVMSAMSVMSIK